MRSSNTSRYGSACRLDAAPLRSVYVNRTSRRSCAASVSITVGSGDVLVNAWVAEVEQLVDVVRGSGTNGVEPVVPALTAHLARLVSIRLGYLPLGQPLTTLSGGERQQLKLATEPDKPSQVYVFDEPTTGLHPADVDELVAIFDRFVDGRATVIVIEHDLDVIRRADHVIDLGPGPGRRGGHVLFTGTPAELARQDTHTGRHLREHTCGQQIPR